MIIPRGLCQCGCGEKTNVVPQSRRKSGVVKGDHYDFISGHQGRGTNNPRWKGGLIKGGENGSYVMRWNKNHPRANSLGYVYEQILVAEAAMGKSLPLMAEVHHFNSKPSDNRPQNLIVCEDRAYHMILHQRERAFRDCGHAHWRKCKFCGQYDDPLKMYIKGSHGYHPECGKKYDQDRRKNGEFGFHTMG